LQAEFVFNAVAVAVPVAVAVAVRPVKTSPIIEQKPDRTVRDEYNSGSAVLS